jgi:hypothetical protein
VEIIAYRFLDIANGGGKWGENYRMDKDRSVPNMQLSKKLTVLLNDVFPKTACIFSPEPHTEGF